MARSFNVRDGVSKLLGPELFEGITRDALESWLRDDVLPEADKRTPKHKGDLARSARVYLGPRSAGIKYGSRKAGFVHGRFALPAPPRRRTRPHFPPANQSLVSWSKAKGIPVFLVQRAIAERGTPIVPFLAEAVEVTLPRLRKRLDTAARNIERKFNGR